MSPEQASVAYEATLKRFYGAEIIVSNRPLFDVTLLGIGEDGHTASLFPDHPALEERLRWVVEVSAPDSLPRITLTCPSLNSSRNVAFLMTGEGKRGVVRTCAGRRPDDARSQGSSGRSRLHWFMDRAAASGGAY